jgi:hypothetical protein
MKAAVVAVAESILVFLVCEQIGSEVYGAGGGPPGSTSRLSESPRFIGT